MSIRPFGNNEPSKSFGLSSEAKACILKTLGPDAQAMIDKYEEAERQQAGYIPMPSSLPKSQGTGSSGVSGSTQTTNTASYPVFSVDDVIRQYESGNLSGPEAAKSAADLLKGAVPGRQGAIIRGAGEIFRALKDDPHVGKVARLGLAVTGEVDFPDNPPYESLLDRCERHSRPVDSLLPGCITALENAETTKPEELVDLTEKIIDTIPYDNERPMEKPYAGIRLMIELANSLGEVKVSEIPRETGDFISTGLHNLKTDGQSLLLAQVTCDTFKNSFAQLRKHVKMANEAQEMIWAVSPNEPKPVSQKIEMGSDAVTIGGVKLKINKRKDN